MSMQIITPSLEQGTIDSNGDRDSTKNVRSADYIIFNSCALNVVITAQSVSGKSILVDLIGYETNTSTSPEFDLYWYESGYRFDIANYSGVKYLRIVLKFEDGSDISPSDISECEVKVETTPIWFIGSEGLPTTDEFLPFPDNSLAGDLPKMMWRITSGVNNGLPYHELLSKPDLLGSFANAKNLQRVSIPKSVKKIGRYAFRNTQLTSATIAKDYEYYDTSFPDNCIIKFY